MSVTVRQACREDLPDIIAIEEASFSVPWSHQSLAAELDNPVARYYVLEKEDGSVAGYADVWLIADEGQLANIAIHPSARGLGYGEILLRTAMEALFREGCTSFFLEVRQSLLSARTIIPSLWKMRASCIVKKRSINGSAIHYRKKDEIYVYLSFRNEL